MADITKSCFQVRHIGANPGDKKIWFTDKINTDSLGRGIQVPAELLPAALRGDINEVLDGLGYRLVDARWNSTSIRVDPRRDAGPGQAEAASPGLGDSSESSWLLSAIREKAGSRSAADAGWIAEHWDVLEGRTLRIIVQVPGGVHQRLDLTIMSGAARHSTGPEDGSGENTMTLAADSATWRGLFEGTANIDSERKAGRLRLMDARMRRPLWDEIYGVAVILGLAPVPLTAVP